MGSSLALDFKLVEAIWPVRKTPKSETRSRHANNSHQSTSAGYHPRTTSACKQEVQGSKAAFERGNGECCQPQAIVLRASLGCHHCHLRENKDDKNLETVALGTRY